MAQQQPTTQNGKSSSGPQMKGGMGSVKSKAQDLVQDLKEDLKEGNIENLTGTLKKSFGEVSSQFEEQINEVKDVAQQYVTTLTDYYKAHPVRVLVSAVGVGIVLGRLLGGGTPMIAKK